VADHKRYPKEVAIALQGYFEDHLDTFLEKLENLYSVPVARVGIVKAGETRVQRYPRFKILANRISHNYGFDTQPLTEPWMIYRCLLTIEYVSGDIQEVEDTLYYCSEAVNRMVEDDSTFGGLFVDVRLGDEDYTPMFEDQKTKQMAQGITIELQVQTR